MKCTPGLVYRSGVVAADKLSRDWEWLGGYPDEVQTNYFGKGISTSSGGDTTEEVDDAQDTSHNYTLYWTEESLSWYLDGSLLRTLNYADASNGDEYPQTPSRVKLGIWAGGDSENAAGTISWAGGETDYDEGPFTMIVESVDITNFNPAESYTYSDQTGDYTSIDFDVASDSDDDPDTTASTTTLTTSAFAVSASKDSHTTATPIATGSASQVSGDNNSDTSSTGNSNSGSTKSSNDVSNDQSSNSDSGDKNSGQSFGNGRGKDFGNSIGKGRDQTSAKNGGSAIGSFANGAGRNSFI